MKNRIYYSILALAMVSGCAKGANSIVPLSVPPTAYSNLECPALSRELLKEQEIMNALSKQQNQAAIGDAIGVALILIPTASITGHDREGKLAVSKGKVLTIENVVQAKGCNSLENVTPAVVE